MTNAVSPIEDALAGIEATQRRALNATISFDRDVVRLQAREIASRTSPTPLNRMAVGIKDNICTLEYSTTCGSRILADYQSPFEATAVTRLKAAGGIVACKTNLDEFGMGSSTEHSAFGRVRHPLDPDRVPGGSSGGSAALVAAGAVRAALGSETGGSVRQPAAFCGIVGIKPSYGRVSRHGLVAFGSSLDQIGVFGRNVSVAATVLEAMSGRDSNDATCADLDPLSAPLERQDLAGLVIGLPSEFYPEDLDPAIAAACKRTIAALESAGATTRTVSLPHTHLACPCYYVIAPAEASANLARYDGVRYGLRVTEPDLHTLYRATRGTGFGAEVRRRIIIGTYVLSAGYHHSYYTKAQLARARIAQDFAVVFSSGVDLLFTPTTPTTAFKAGERLHDPVAMYHTDVFVASANLAGIPAMSLPIGRSDGLPIGGQIFAPPFGEARMLDVAHVLENHIEAEREAR